MTLLATGWLTDELPLSSTDRYTPDETSAPTNAPTNAATSVGRGPRRGPEAGTAVGIGVKGGGGGAMTLGTSVTVPPGSEGAGGSAFVNVHHDRAVPYPFSAGPQARARPTRRDVGSLSGYGNRTQLRTVQEAS